MRESLFTSSEAESSKCSDCGAPKDIKELIIQATRNSSTYYKGAGICAECKKIRLIREQNR